LARTLKKDLFLNHLSLHHKQPLNIYNNTYEYTFPIVYKHFCVIHLLLFYWSSHYHFRIFAACCGNWQIPSSI